MRDFRDAKAMAQTLRAALAAKGHAISNSESLELIAKALGVADWNTLSATIRKAVAPEDVPPEPRARPDPNRASDCGSTTLKPISDGEPASDGAPGQPAQAPVRDDRTPVAGAARRSETPRR